MSMQNPIYGGVPGPSWYVFDKVHLGSAKTLLEQASSDGIFIGRYVLVKYCEGLHDFYKGTTSIELRRHNAAMKKTGKSNRREVLFEPTI